MHDILGPNLERLAKRLLVAIFIFYGLSGESRISIGSTDESVDGSGTRYIPILMNDDEDNVKQLAIEQYAEFFVSGQQKELKYINGSDNQHYTLPFPEDSKEEMVSYFVKDKIRFSDSKSNTPMLTNDQIAVISQYSNYNDVDLKWLNSYISGDRDKQASAAVNFENDELRILATNKILSRTGDESIKDKNELFKALKNRPDSLDGKLIDWNELDFDKMTPEARDNFMKAVRLDSEAKVRMASSLCNLVNTVINSNESFPIGTWGSLIDLAKRTLANFSFLNEHGADPNFNCEYSGMPLGQQVIALADLVSNSENLSDEEKKRLLKLIDIDKIRSQMRVEQTIESVDNKHCDSFKAFLGESSELCSLSDILYELYQQTQKDTLENQKKRKKAEGRKQKPEHTTGTHRFPVMKENEGPYGVKIGLKNEPCSVELMYEVNALVINQQKKRTIQNGKIKMAQVKGANAIEREYSFENMPLEDFQNLIKEAYEDAVKSRK